MRAEFDIGDFITARVTGKVIKYSADNTGDCYTIEVNDGKGRADWLYFSSDNLKLCDAKRIAREV